MADAHHHVDQAAPPDEWLALSDAERAEMRRRASDVDPKRMEGDTWREVDATIVLEPVSQDDRGQPPPLPPPPPPTLEDTFEAAKSLEADDRMRLVTRLWVSLPREQRAAVLRFQLDDFIDSPDPPESQAAGEDPLASLWRALFDPANTSRLYSAPQRFDLATIFVVTAAYSLLFGVLTALDGYWASFGAGTASGLKIVLGSIITLVAASQALLRGVVNPRGVSIVAGAAAYTMFSVFFWWMYPRAFPVSLFTIVVLNGLFIGAAIGYISGVLVGGVFLAADVVRGKFEGSAEQPEDASEEPSAEPANAEATCKN